MYCRQLTTNVDKPVTPTLQRMWWYRCKKNSLRFKILACVLLASLLLESVRWRTKMYVPILTFAGLPSFCPMAFHLFASYSLIASRKATDLTTVNYNTTRAREPIPHLPRILHSAYPSPNQLCGRVQNVVALPCTNAF